MAKITLNPIVGSYASVVAINARLQQIEDAFNDDVLWRDGFTGEPNSMDVDFDMAGYSILNAVIDPTNIFNADTLDGLDSTQFLRSDENDTTTGTLTAAGFIGPLTGDTVGENTGPTYVVNDNPPDTTMFPLITGSNAVGMQDVSTDGSFKWNASANELTVPTVIADVTGDLTGNADTASVATLATVADTAVDSSHSVILSPGSGSPQNLKSDTALTYNPSTNILTIGGTTDTTTLSINGTAVTKTATEINRSLYFPDAASPAISNVATRANKFLGFDAAGAMVYTAGSTTVSANAVSITDAGGYYSPATEVEAALQEVGSDLSAVTTATTTNTTKIAGLNTKVIDIGDWNMDNEPTPIPTPTHGLTLSKIRNVTVIIRNDADTIRSDINLRTGGEIYSAGATQGVQCNATEVLIYRPINGLFDTTDYNSTTYNRGWITIQYID